ncbi:Fe-S cluster assembly protein SufD [Psychrilyobacter atlanticus]|uniref:Fe-S cluster assembly protein SufD n=1 Tax=Psychrilyobacter atlanticus TaxID=271091 RepID=UPI0003FC2DD7|nr:Fe-S cluster assembly protein SufD [Psychrilyobacter atlanticus]
MYKIEKIRNLNEKQDVTNYRLDQLEKNKDMGLPSFKRIGYEFSLPAEYKNFENIKLGDTSRTLSPIEKKLGELQSIKWEKNESYLANLTDIFFNTGVFLESKKSETKEVYVNYDLDKENNLLLDNNLLIAERDSVLNVVFDYSGGDKEAVRNSLHRVLAKENSQVNIIYLQRACDCTKSFNSVIVKTERDAQVKQYHIELGGKVVSSSSKVYLEGDNAESKTYSLYLADKEKKVDLEYSTYHRGRRSESVIEGRGVVKDKATKVFRGNLYFERGSGKSKGKEEEYALLLNKGVKADSIPTLFCDEDDVIGEHSASAGQLNENKLFYLMSRGMSEKEAKKLVVSSSFKPIVEKIKDMKLRDKVLKIIEERI